MKPFNPLDKLTLAESVVRHLLGQERRMLPVPPQLAGAETKTKYTGTDRCRGAGVYAIYYAGEHPLYASLSARNATNQNEVPIYVGKADPPGARQGGESDESSASLFHRLRDHARSVEDGTLGWANFYCRFLIVDELWIPLAESMLIRMFKPVWNLKLDGFGNHAPGAGRKDMRCPDWDLLHPGRAWAAKLVRDESIKARLESEITAHLAQVLQGS